MSCAKLLYDGGVSKKIFSIIPHWLPLGMAITLVCGTVYASARFILRSEANDPQIQVAEDTVRFLDNEGVYPEMLNQFPVPIGKSLSSYVVLYNLDKEPIAGGAELGGELPALPSGVFDYAKQNGEHRFTWQPKPGVRQAAVLLYHAGKNPGYVLAGRSLREVEVREYTLLSLVGFGWVVTILCSFLVALVLS